MRTMRIARGKQMSQEAKEEAKEKQRAKRAARFQDEKDADRKRECELQRERRAAARAAKRALEGSPSLLVVLIFTIWYDDTKSSFVTNLFHTKQQGVGSHVSSEPV